MILGPKSSLCKSTKISARLPITKSGFLEGEPLMSSTLLVFFV